MHPPQLAGGRLMARALWSGLLGHGDYRDVSWIVPLALALTFAAAALTAAAVG
jgi:hypothetical protein